MGKKKPRSGADLAGQQPGHIWKHDPDEHDYPAADSFLRLLTSPAKAKAMVARLGRAPVELHPAKDVLRAARLELLPGEDPSVSRDLNKVMAGQLLSPVLIVRGDFTRGIPSVIADGYHRVCASYHLSENELIPCRIADMPRAVS